LLKLRSGEAKSLAEPGGLARGIRHGSERSKGGGESQSAEDAGALKGDGWVLFIL